MNETLRTIANRRSIRSFRPEQVRDEELHLLAKIRTWGESHSHVAIWEIAWECDRV